MKKVLLLCVLCLMLFGVRAYAADEYIVWLDDAVQLFSTGTQTRGDGFVTMPEAELEECLEAGIVEQYIPNAMVTLCEQSWNMQAVGMNFPQKTGCWGNDVTVAVIDTGVQPIGVLEGRVLKGKNYLTNTEDTTDTNGHGTFVSGIIASGAEKCKILPLKCFSGKTTSLDYIFDAIYDAVVTYQVDVINMSFGTSAEDNGLTAEETEQVIEVFNQFVSNASSLGTIVVAAVGNDGTEVKHYPASCTDAIGVGAVKQNKEHCSFSQYNDSVFVVAPGQGVVSTAISGYENNSGTSFSAPHVSALAAIVKSMDESIDTTGFKTLLISTSDDLGEEGRDDYFGYGMINCEKAVKKMMEGQEVYISPIDTSDTGSSAVFYNNTNESATLCLIGAHYREGCMNLAPVVESVTLGPGEVYKLDYPGAVGHVNFMVWVDFIDMRPLSVNRRK